MNDIRLALMCGSDIPIPEIQAAVHQPKMKEIALIGEADFFVAIQCLNVDKNLLRQDKTLLQNTSNFQIFMTIMSESETADKKFAVEQLGTLLFPDSKLSFTPRSIIMSGKNGFLHIDESNFEPLQDIVSQVCCLKSGMRGQDVLNPQDVKAKEIADKIMRGRQRIAAEKGESNASIFTQQLSILTVGLNSMSLKDLMDLTVFQVYDLLERYSLYVNWDMDIRSRLAGGKPDSQPDNWMKNIH